ncbi:MAG: TerB family tellurite resistance protein [Enhygromyxa sp.]
MPHPQVMFMIRLLAAVSWADKVLADSEAAAIERLINAAELDDDERAKARSWLAAPVDIDAADVDALNMNQRLATYQAALRVALSDDELAEEERVLLDRIRDVLGISAEQALEIEAEAGLA